MGRSPEQPRINLILASDLTRTTASVTLHSPLDAVALVRQ